jgi:hypothetical protein
LGPEWMRSDSGEDDNDDNDYITDAPQHDTILLIVREEPRSTTLC